MGRRFGSVLELPGSATPAGNPPAGAFLLYFKSDGLLYRKNSAGVEVAVATSGTFEPAISAGATTQYWRGDKTWQTLDKIAVGLDQLNNTSDANKPISTAVSTALAGKEPTVAVGTSLQYYRGDKTWQTLNLAALPDAWVKRSVRVASTANVVIATGGLQTVDGIVTAAGDRVLLKNQTAPAENGIYQVNAGAWTRATDATTSAMMAGADVAVDSGTQGGFLYSNLFKTTDTLGTTAMNWYRVIDASLLGVTGGVEPFITVGTTAQYRRGDKTWQTLDKTAVGLANVDNTSDVLKPVSTAVSNALAAKADLVSGVVPSSQIPAVALVSAQVVASQAAMLALTTAQVQPGDLAIRTDGAGTFILTATDPSVLGNWTRLNAPTDAVVSVNGQVGTVVLGKGDVGLALAENTTDLGKPISTATQTALDAKEPTVPVGTASQFWRGDKVFSPINGANLLQNPGFEDVGGVALLPHSALGTPVLTTSTVARSGLGAGHIRAATVTVPNNTDVFIANGTTVASHPRCAVGETYRAEFWVRDGASNTTPATVRAYIAARDSTGAVLEQTIGATVTVSTTAYGLLAVELTITNALAHHIVCGINVPNGMVVNGAFRIDDMALRWVPPISTATQSALDAKAPTTVQPGAPASPVLGALWWDTDEVAAAAVTVDQIGTTTGDIIAPPPLTSRLTAAATNATAIFQSTGLSVPVVAGKTYLISARGQYQSAATTAGMGMNIGGTATATGIRAELTIKGLTATTNQERSLNTMGQNTSTGATTVTANADFHWAIEGEIRVLASGTLLVNFRSSTTTTVTVQPDSTLIVQEIP